MFNCQCSYLIVLTGGVFWGFCKNLHSSFKTHRGICHMSDTYVWIVLKLLSDKYLHFAFGFECGVFCFSGMGNLIITGFVRVKLIYRIYFPQKRRSKCNCIFMHLMLFVHVFAIDLFLQLLPRLQIEMLQKFLHCRPFLSQNVLGIRRYTVIFMVVPTEMKVIKSYASRSKLIAGRVRKHFFSLHHFLLCTAQSIVCSVVCFYWPFPGSVLVTSGSAFQT